MAKTPKKAWRTGKTDNAPRENDDGTRWIIVREGRQVYPGAGITRKEAERLRDGLREPAEMVQVK